MTITIPNHFRPVKPLRICLFAFLFACISYRLYNGAFLRLYLDTGHSLKSLYPFIIGKGTTTERHFRSVLSPDIHSYRDSRTVVYDFNLGKKVLEPDGVKKEVLTVNGTRSTLNEENSMNLFFLFLKAFSQVRPSKFVPVMHSSSMYSTG